MTFYQWQKPHERFKGPCKGLCPRPLNNVASKRKETGGGGEALVRPLTETGLTVRETDYNQKYVGKMDGAQGIGLQNNYIQ